MAKKNKLPDSLELLLDTMCNTFGAIMFIAISLVIISQVTTKIVRDKQPIEITEELLAGLRAQVRELEDELAMEELKMAARALAALGMSPDKKEKVERLLSLKSETQRLVLVLTRQRQEMEQMGQAILDVQNAIDNVKNEIKQLQVEIDQQARLLGQMMLTQQQQMEKLQAEFDKANRENKELAPKAKNARGVPLTFSMEVSTDNEEQWLICLRNGRLYRERAGEVVAVPEGDKYGHFEFRGGNEIPQMNPDVVFHNLLQEITSRYFVTIFCDENSYPVLVELRKYLRRKQLKVNFIYTEDWEFSRGGSSKASY